MSDSTRNIPWSLAWADEFDSDGAPDARLWKFQVRPPWVVEAIGLVERHHFAPPQLGNARVESGHLVIEARKENYPGVAYSSACLVSVATIRYGRIEVRAKLPTGQGMWPAIWLIPPGGKESGGWPRCGEIDLVEHIGAVASKVHLNVITGAVNMADGTSIGQWVPLPGLGEEFHVYAMEWTEREVRLDLDGTRVISYAKTPGAGSDQWPFDAPFELRLQLGLGGLKELGTEVDESLLPQRMYIDYVRVYQRAAVD